MTPYRSAALRTAIGSYGHTLALKDRTVSPRTLALDFVEYEPVNRAFKPMVEQLRSFMTRSSMRLSVAFYQALRKSYGVATIRRRSCGPSSERPLRWRDCTALPTFAS